MAPFFTKEIINQFLGEFIKYRDIDILTNEDDESRLEPLLPIIVENASEICRGSIGDEYLENTILDRAFGQDTIFDTAILLETGDPVPIGFIVVEKGECKREGFENIWSVNLICAKETSLAGKSGLGQVLMGLYLYTIDHNKKIQPKTAILELANGYINAGGLASYMKLGFVVEEKMYGSDCFEDYGNLPMIVNRFDTPKLIAILNGTDPGYPKLPICNIRGDLQLYLGLCKNLFTFINHNKLGYIESKYELADKRIINFDLLEKMLYEQYATINGILGKRRKKVDPIYKEWLSAYIANIETNFTTMDQNEFNRKIRELVTPAPEKKKTEVLVNMERRLRSGLNLNSLPIFKRQRSHGGRSKRNKGSKKNIRKTRRK
jgi:hypothetical protein